MKKKWWHQKVAYQIYPKSFKDTTGNGIGDLRGIIEKLDYLKDLGVDIIWLSPCYCSPLADQGYDISDYYNIDPRFGTMEDMDELIAKAKERDMYILMDLVINHCSDEHEWFKKAIADPTGEYASYFYIEDAVDGHEPNNWRSYFGGSVWEKIPGTDKYYLHLFHKKQPDLNWENPKLREEIYTMVNWWLDRGLGGFRIDAIINIKKALPFTKFSYAPDRNDGLTNCTKMLEDTIGLGDFLTELKNKTFAPHDAFTAGEVFNEREEEIPLFIGDDGYFSTMFDFESASFGENGRGWYKKQPITPDDYKKCCFKTQKRIGDIGMISTIIENHDEPRGVSHYIPEGECSDTSKKLLATMQLMLRGLPFIYQGQEIGMENQVFESVEDFDDIATINGYHVAKEAGLSEEEALAAIANYSRDNARTPMQWSAEPGLGFSDGPAWLISPKPDYSINVEDQEKDPDSILNYYRQLTALYRHPLYGNTIRFGDMIPAYRDRENIIAFERRGDKRLLVISNFQNRQATLELPAPIKTVVLNNTAGLFQEGDQVLELTPYQTVVLELVE